MEVDDASSVDQNRKANEESAKFRFGRKLASTDKKTRDKAVKTVTNWLSKRNEFNEKESLIIWKALYACFWLSDKPLIQQDLAIKISKLIHVIPGNGGLSFSKGFFITLNGEWHNIDRFRLDKYYSLLRKMLFETFNLLKRRNFDQKSVEFFTSVLSDDVFLAMGIANTGIGYQITEIYLQELYRSTQGEISEEVVFSLLRPFAKIMVVTPHRLFLSKITKNVFESLAVTYDYIVRTVEEGTQVQEEDTPVINFSASDFSNLFFECASSAETDPSNRKSLYHLKRVFQELATGESEENNSKKRKTEELEIKKDDKKDDENDDDDEEQEANKEKEKESKKQKLSNGKKSNNKEKESNTDSGNYSITKHKKKFQDTLMGESEDSKETEDKQTEDIEVKEEEMNGNGNVAKKTKKTRKPRIQDEIKAEETSPKSNTKEQPKTPESKAQGGEGFTTPKSLNGTPTEKSNGHSNGSHTTPRRKSISWTKDRFQEYAESLKVHPESPAVRNKAKTPSSILRAITSYPTAEERKNGTPMKAKKTATSDEADQSPPRKKKVLKK